MTARAFDFYLATAKCWAMGHPTGKPSVSLALSPIEQTSVMVRLSPAEARAMAVALEAAATHAENVIADTGLGESAVDAPTVAS